MAHAWLRTCVFAKMDGVAQIVAFVRFSVFYLFCDQSSSPRRSLRIVRVVDYSDTPSLKPVNNIKQEGIYLKEAKYFFCSYSCCALSDYLQRHE
jgi:hypothetical protein